MGGRLSAALAVILAAVLVVGGCGGGGGAMLAAVDFAFSGFNGTDWDIYVKKSGAVQPLVVRAGDQTHPSLSWDRQMCVFENELDGRRIISKADTATGTVQPLIVSALDCTDPEISPDGNLVVFVQSTGPGESDLWISNIGGGALTQLTNWPGAEVDPTWSADGRAIYFASNRSGNFDIWRIDIYGCGETQITNSSANERYPAMASFMELLVYASDADGDWELWYKDARRLDQPGVQVTNNAFDDLEPSWCKIGNSPNIMYASYIGGVWQLRKQCIIPIQAPSTIDVGVPARQPSY